MLKLLPVFLICCMLGVLSEYRTKHERALILTGRKDNLIYFLLVVYMVLFAGLRTRYNDTTTYLWAYQILDISKGLFYGMEWSLSASDGFQIMLRLMKAAKLEPNTMLMAFGAIDIGLTMWFVRKYSDDIGLCVFLVFATGVYTFNLAALMQCTATALAFIAVDFAIRKKWVPFVLVLLVAMTFHTYVIVFAVTPFISFQPWSKKTYWLLGLFLIIGIFLPQFLGLVVDVTSAMGEGYDLESFTGAGVNIFRFLVVSVPMVLSFILRKKMEGHTTRADNIIINLGMLNAEIMFVALFGTANYFARLANYFLLFQMLTLPRILHYMDKGMRQLMTGLMVVGYTGYFIYANAINQAFDTFYDAISLFEYLGSIF